MSLDKRNIRLGVNIDHVATIRNARGGFHPDPLLAAQIAEQSGADGITAHLREDRRHISDLDIKRISEKVKLPLNLEMAPTEEMLNIAIKHRPHACCLVPEKRQEITTEGGLNLKANFEIVQKITRKLKLMKIKVSLFIESDMNQITLAKDLDADIVELHTGAYGNLFSSGEERAWKRELDKLKKGANLAESKGLEVHAGHGLNINNVKSIASIQEIRELNIGHFLIGEAIFSGLKESILQMKMAINKSIT